MTIEQIKAYHAKDGLGCTLSDDVMIDWLIEEYDRLTAANKVLNDALSCYTAERDGLHEEQDHQRETAP